MGKAKAGIIGVLGGALALLCVGIALLLAGVTYLRTPSGTRFLVSRLDQLLKEKGVKLEYARGSFDLFTGGHLEGFKLVQDVGNDASDIHIEVTAPSVDIQYDVSVL